MAASDHEMSSDWATELESLEAILHPGEIERMSPTTASFLVSDEEDPSRKLRMIIGPTPAYPDEAPNIKISVLEGNFPLSSAQVLQAWACSFAEQRCGLPLLFDLIQELKYQLPFVREFVDAGVFGVLPDDVFSYMLGFLPPIDLGRVCRVSKRWLLFASDSTLWRQWSVALAGTGAVEERERADRSIGKVTNWRTAYAKSERAWLRQITALPNIIPIYQRKGTGDEWSDEKCLNWRNSFKEELEGKGIFLLPDGNIKSLFSRISEGKYRFWDPVEADKTFWTFSWYRAAQELSIICPYVGNILGFFNWDAGVSMESAVIPAARGHLSRLDMDWWQPSVIKTQVYVHLTISRGKITAMSIDPARSGQFIRFFTERVISNNAPYATELRKLVNASKSNNNVAAVTHWFFDIRPLQLPPR